MCTIDWSLIGMKQFLYATHQHSEKQKKIYTVKLLLVLSISRVFLYTSITQSIDTIFTVDYVSVLFLFSSQLIASIICLSQVTR